MVATSGARLISEDAIETLKAELLAFLELGDDEFDISSMGEFEEQFVEFIKDDLSYAD